MSDEERRGGDIERDGARRRQLDASDGGSADLPDRRTRSSNRSESRLDSSDGASLVDAVAGSLSRRDAVTVESASARATLVGVPTVDVAEFVYSHQSDEIGQRPVALFDVENTSDVPLTWQSTRTQFVGDDTYTYQPSRLALDPSQLGPGCHTRQVEVPPGRKARVVTLVETLPPNVDIVEVVHTLPARTGPGGRERLVFSL